MHKFLRAIGFSEIKDHNELHELIMETIRQAEHRNYSNKSDDMLLAEFCRDYSSRFGLAVCGEFDQNDKFTYEYYFPYLKGSSISSEEDISVERHASKESYAGVCDELRVGVSLVFYLQNMVSYVKVRDKGLLPLKGTTLSLAALSDSGTVLMPIQKNVEEVVKTQKTYNKRKNLLMQARQGNEEAIETLTLEDMDTYSTISKRIRKEDILSLIDTYFMPYGVECDQYAILAEIKECELQKNMVTGEEVYIMNLCCNDLVFDVCINKKDLFGEPLVGRRFKGNIWMQGKINFPE